MKDEGGNLSTLTQTFSFVLNCIPLAFLVPWSKGSCFGHTFSKGYQYACNDINVYVGFHEVSLKATQSMLYKNWLRSSTKDIPNG
jgi:hypothetical protein